MRAQPEDEEEEDGGDSESVGSKPERTGGISKTFLSTFCHHLLQGSISFIGAYLFGLSWDFCMKSII